MNKGRGYVVVYRSNKEASVLWIRIWHTILRNGGTVYLTFVFVNRENEQTVKIETVLWCSAHNKDKIIVNMGVSIETV